MPAGLLSARVVRVVDGDTVDVLLGDKTVTLRLIGMDTPEVVDPRKPVQCFGREASDRGHQLLDGQTVHVEYDLSQGSLDKYGRTLAYVWMSDGRLYNYQMIYDGYAHEYTYDLPYRYQAEFKQAEREAREAQRGLWSTATCNGDTTKPAVSVTATAVLVATATPQPFTPTPKPAAGSGHTYYLSTYRTAHEYYCDTDPAWHNLSPKYLVHLNSEEEVQRLYPGRTLHAPC